MYQLVNSFQHILSDYKYMVLWVPFWTSFNMLIKSFINKLIKIIDKCSLYISYENDFSSFYFENLKLSFSTALCFCLWFTCKCLMKCVYVYQFKMFLLISKYSKYLNTGNLLAHITKGVHMESNELTQFIQSFSLSEVTYQLYSSLVRGWQEWILRLTTVHGNL